MNTVADLDSARMASFWMEVLAGRTPRAMRFMRVRGRRRSSIVVTSVSDFFLGCLSCCGWSFCCCWGCLGEDDVVGCGASGWVVESIDTSLLFVSAIAVGVEVVLLRGMLWLDVDA